ncbi:hypothetical protein [Plastoroseomonas arctica]|uniref:Uncharacterized protein n=1 Tax=Plastoroseomonas arctica TaxID=1509237 RepID=A0AAF1JYL3_9PROT|nr:hypothetical protein [Plastoroseomonas arctica]MBR0657049.1 hypothetical protein [Plastoroseomonas arctica]
MPESEAELDALALALLRRLGLPSGPTLPDGPTGGPDPRLPELPPFDKQVPDLVRPARLAIQGVEFTQATQYFTSGFGEDNAIPMVALKPMLVRAYPHAIAGLLTGDTLSGQQVTGELVLSRWGKEVYRTAPTRPGGARLGRLPELDRTLWDKENDLWVTSRDGLSLTHIRGNAPLNFFVPAWYLRAAPTVVTVRLWVASAPGIAAVASRRLDVLNVAAPRVALVRIKWDNGAGMVVTPADADMLGTLRLAERMLPFPYFDTTILGVDYTRSGNFGQLPGSSGACNALWNEMLARLKETRIWTRLFQLADIVIGIVPAAAIPVGQAGGVNTGCGSGGDGVGAFFAGQEMTTAHELGHIYQRAHVNVPNDPSDDPNYPKYVKGFDRSIGEVGLDVALSPPTLYDPATAIDVMAYTTAAAEPQWISPYTYSNILDRRSLYATSPADTRRLRPWLILTFGIERLARGGRTVELVKAMVVEAAGHVGGSATAGESPVSIDLLDAHDRILATHHAYPIRSQPGGCGCHGGQGGVPEGREPYLTFVEAIPLPDGEVARITFHTGDAPLLVVEAGEPPRVSLTGPDREEDGLHLRLEVSASEGRASTLVLFTGDDGETWVPVVQDPPEGTPLVIDPQRLPGGSRCRFRAVATAGLRSATAETDSFELPRRGRGLFVQLETDPCERATVRLRALVDARGLGAVPPQDVRWESDRDGELGQGFEQVARLSEGTHAISASMPDGLGGRLTERAIIIIGGRPRHLGPA